MNIQFTDKQELPNLRVISWTSQKGNNCELHVFQKQKEYSLKIFDKSTGEIISNFQYNLLLDAIIGLINVIITDRNKKQEDWWDKRNNFAERLFTKFFGWK